MRDFLQSAWGLSHSHSGEPKLFISLANLVDLHLRGSGVDSSALVWAQWCFSVSYGAGLGSVLLPRGSWSLSISRKKGGYGRKRGKDEYTEWYQRGERERERDRGMRGGNRKREKEGKSNQLFRLPTICNILALIPWSTTQYCPLWGLPPQGFVPVGSTGSVLPGLPWRVLPR